MWRSTAYISTVRVGEDVWLFENGLFTKTIEYTDGSIFSAGLGVYSVGSNITRPSGLTKNKLDLIYVNNQDDSAVRKLNVVYIDSQILYLGNEKINDACEGVPYQLNDV